MTKGWIGVVVTVGAISATAVSCSTPGAPTGPSSLAAGSGVASVGADDGTHMHTASATEKPEDKGYIDGWFDGSDVQLYYTKSYYCAEPPSSGASSNCELARRLRSRLAPARSRRSMRSLPRASHRRRVPPRAYVTRRASIIRP